MKHFRVIAAVAITGLVGVIPAAAQGKSGTAGAGATGHGRPTPTTSPAGAKATASDATPHGKSADAGTHGSDKSGKPSKTTTASTSTTNTTTPGANALSTKIASHPEQLAKINGMLPQGMTLDQATAGFRNQGQFIAALNASKQQGVPFASLQKAMTVDGLSLGQAVRQLKTPPAPAPTGSSSSATGGGSVTTPTTGAS